MFWDYQTQSSLKKLPLNRTASHFLSLKHRPLSCKASPVAGASDCIRELCKKKLVSRTFTMKIKAKNEDQLYNTCRLVSSFSACLFNVSLLVIGEDDFSGFLPIMLVNMKNFLSCTTIPDLLSKRVLQGMIIHCPSCDKLRFVK